METGSILKGPFLVLMLNAFLGTIGVSLAIPVLPAYLAEMGAGGRILGLLVAAFSLTQFLFSPMAGQWTDKYGRRKFILLGMALFCLSEGMFAVGKTLWVLFVSRLLGGLAAACIIPAVMAFVADVTSERLRAKGMGWLAAAMSLGLVIGPGVGGFLAEFGVRMPFYFASAVAFVALLFSFFLLPETRSLRSQLRARRSRGRGEPLWRQLVRSMRKPYALLFLLIFAMSFGLANFESVFGLFVDDRFGFTPKDIAVVVTCAALAGVLAQVLLVEKLSAFFGERAVVMIAMALTAVGYAGILLAWNFWSVLLVTVGTFMATAVLRPTITALLSKMAGDEQGFVAGMNNAYMSIGNVAGPLAAGFLYDYNQTWPFLSASLVFIFSFAVALMGLRRTARGREAGADEGCDVSELG